MANTISATMCERCRKHERVAFSTWIGLYRGRDGSTLPLLPRAFIVDGSGSIRRFT